MTRPGIDDSYPVGQAADILGVNRDTLRGWIEDGVIEAERALKGGGRHRFNFTWRVSRAALLRFADRHKLGAVACRLRVEAQPDDSNLYAATSDQRVVEALSRVRVVYEPSLVGIGMRLAGERAWGVLIDFARVGRDAAFEAAERIARDGDHPYLIALAAADESSRPARKRGLWDLILDAETAPPKLAAVVRQLAARAGAAQRQK